MDKENVHTKYSIVIPVFNSANIVGETIERTVRCLQQNNLNYELILVNDGSKDGVGSLFFESHRHGATSPSCRDHVVGMCLAKKDSRPLHLTTSEPL